MSYASSRDVILRTPHWDKAIHFYRVVLGLPVISETRTIIGFETGKFRLYVEDGEAHGPVFEFFVPDVQSEKSRLLAAGCVLIEEDASVPRVYIRDPQGLAFNLAMSPSDSTRRP